MGMAQGVYRLGLAGIRNSIISALLLHTSVPSQCGEGCKNSAITKKGMGQNLMCLGAENNHEPI